MNAQFARYFSSSVAAKHVTHLSKDDPRYALLSAVQYENGADFGLRPPSRSAFSRGPHVDAVEQAGFAAVTVMF